MRADLHMHSTASDGSFGVRELVRAVHAAGVSVFALTDHDTVEGLDEARDEATRLGCTLLNGVEISTRLDQVEIHVLGYGFDHGHPALVQALEQQRRMRVERIPKIVERLRGLGVDIHEEHVLRAAGGGAPGRPHVARALVELGICRDTEDAFRRFLGDGGPAQVRKSVPSPREAIGWLHEAGGKAVWAHPLARPIQRPLGFDGLARELAGAGLDGIEEIHPGQDPGARKRIRKAARELGLAVTGGSDFHGAASPGVALGVGRGGDLVPTSVVDALLARSL